MYSLSSKNSLEEFGYVFEKIQDDYYEIIDIDYLKYFQNNTWWTPNQIRDNHIENYYFSKKGITTEKVDEFRKMSLTENDRRKTLPKEFVRCNRCYGYHGQLNNIDNLCEKCESQTAPYRYDLKHGHIKQ